MYFLILSYPVTSAPPAIHLLALISPVAVALPANARIFPDAVVAAME